MQSKAGPLAPGQRLFSAGRCALCKQVVKFNQMKELREKRYSTADVMRVYDLGRNTLRLYEEIGLLTGMNRTESGYREYEIRHLEDLKFILEAKKVGFTLNEIKDLLEVVREHKKVTCGTVSSEVSEKVDEIDIQIKTLKAKKLFLADFLKTCGSKNKESECNVMAVGFSKSACCS